jgi:hypothetical protein
VTEQQNNGLMRPWQNTKEGLQGYKIAQFQNVTLVILLETVNIFFSVPPVRQHTHR